ncbi:MAG: ATP-binding cassette domain-containing protein [Butyricicoccus sp.]
MPISIKNIQKAFGAKQVLNGIDYELEDGGVYCLMGPSGMGKTTLLRILMDLENPDGGDVEGLTRNDIAVMFQENRLLEWMDAIDNIAVMRKGIRDKKLKKEIEENLKLILPADCLHQPVTQLSGGMKRRVALARAMNYPSKLIILDEPFTGLDRETKLEVIDYILKMRGNRILLVATHGVEDAAMLGAKVIHLEELLGVDAQEPDEDDENNILLARDEVMRNMVSSEESRVSVIRKSSKNWAATRKPTSRMILSGIRVRAATASALSCRVLFRRQR